jgi:hypothetical protein
MLICCPRGVESKAVRARPPKGLTVVRVIAVAAGSAAGGAGDGP